MNQTMQDLKHNLEKKGYTVHCVPDADSATRYLLEQIEPTQTVGIGGSMTVQEMGIYPMLLDRGQSVYWHWQAQDVVATRDAAGCAQVYLCSANALICDGRIVNIDGTGNRLAGTLSGTGKVYMVIGMNKVSATLEEGIARIKNVACPANARRLNLNTPCATLGYCTDCASSARMCKATLIFDYKPNAHPMEIVLVEQAMGY